ncbi:NAD(P)-binding protein [Exidia glandulosa HHB12029]|uniref:NAD(P)-binding protein n=1 Tax=Exidia glandulosa HHB12029 TaxID=1314781 RepID=A0A165ENM8_EXIGL|nr:NAD(P)-binding protein [Exidia glandulosa HHB12029]
MSLVALIVGAGANVGKGVTQQLKAKGYTVVVGSRSATKIEGASHAVKLDVTKPETIKTAFAEVEKIAGPPNVVIFNPAGFTAPPGDAASVPLEAFSRDVAFGTTGLYTAVQEAVAAFRKAPAQSPKAFIYTGNILPFVPATKPIFLTLGVAKVAAAYQIELFSNSFKDENFRFYFASQISRNGGPVSITQLSGHAHGVAFWNLIERKEQGEWDLRFYEDGSEGPHEPVHL